MSKKLKQAFLFFLSTMIGTFLLIVTILQLYKLPIITQGIIVICLAVGTVIFCVLMWFDIILTKPFKKINISSDKLKKKTDNN